MEVIAVKNLIKQCNRNRETGSGFLFEQASQCSV